MENVRGWYKPLVEPQELALHWFWANFPISPIKIASREHDGGIAKLQEKKGFDLREYRGIDKRKALRNCVEPETGKHILDAYLAQLKAKEGDRR